MVTLRVTLSGCLALGMCLCGSTFGADQPIAAFCFAGSVTSESFDFGEVKSGDAVNGGFTYAFAAQDEIPEDPARSTFDGIDFEVSINEARYTESGFNVSIQDNTTFAELAPIDYFEVSTGLNIAPGLMLGPAGPPLSELPIAQVDIVLIDTDATVFTSDALAQHIPLDAFEIVDEEPFGTTGGRLIYGSKLSGFEDIRFALEHLKRVAYASPDTGVVDIPGVQVNAQVFAVTLGPVPGTNPLRFDVLRIGASSLPPGPDNATFNPATGELHVPAVRLPNREHVEARLRLLPGTAFLELISVNSTDCR